MTVLPYLVITLVVSLGGLDAGRARQLALAGGALLLLFWTLTLAVIWLLPAALPQFQTGAFFSYSMVEPRQALGLIDTFVPANPFNALANAVVPSVVLFSCALGVALIGLPRKRGLLDALRTLEQAIVRVTRFVIRTTPVGGFAIAAVASGTLDLDTLLRLKAYFLLFAVATLLLTFGILPLVVTALTPLRYLEMAGVASDALLTAFVANSVFIVLPILVERMHALLERRQLASPATDATIGVHDRGAEALANMQAPRGPLQVVVRETPPPDTSDGSAFERISARDSLRVDYVRERPPFTFRNGAGELVALDVELAGRLGRGLGVAQVEFVGGDWDEVVTMLAEGRIDVLPSLPYQRGLLPTVLYSRPYADGFVAFAIAGTRRHEFATH